MILCNSGEPWESHLGQEVTTSDECVNSDTSWLCDFEAIVSSFQASVIRLCLEDSTLLDTHSHEFMRPWPFALTKGKQNFLSTFELSTGVHAFTKSSYTPIHLRFRGETICRARLSSQTHPCFAFVAESILIVSQIMNRFSSPWLYRSEKESRLFFCPPPFRLECLSCPRTKVCAHLCWAPAV